MEQFDWIESSGGPLILMDNEVVESWSGILERSSYLQGKSELSTDYMDPLEADYGKACSIKDYIGVINIRKQNVLVFGDEPLPTTIVIHQITKRLLHSGYMVKNKATKRCKMLISHH